MLRGGWRARARAEDLRPTQSRVAIGLFVDRRWTMAKSFRQQPPALAVGETAHETADPCEPGTTVVALGDGINECKGAGVCDAKADRVLCMPKGGSSR